MLSPQQEHFCQLYVSHSNATQAYFKAFAPVEYSTANSKGCQLVKFPEVQERIQQLVEEFNAEFRKNKYQTIKELYETASQCKKEKRYAEYYKLRDMIIKLEGFYEPERLEVKTETNINLLVPGITPVTIPIELSASNNLEALDSGTTDLTDN